MELVLKLPKGKPPFMGICFIRSYEGEKMNSDLITDHSNKVYKIVLEYTGKTLNLRLICEDLVAVRFYNNLTFDPERLKSWLYLSAKHKGFNFGHVSKVNDVFKLLKTVPGNKNFVLKIESCQLITAEEIYERLPY